jgi:hypothetical protein
VSGHKKIISIASVVAVLVLGIGAVQFVTGGSHVSCLDSNDYKDLTGAEMPPTTNPKSSFYSYNLEYSGNTISAPGGDEAVNQIAAFYKSHRNKSVLVTISSINQEPTTAAVAKARMHTLIDQLTAEGVKAEAIRSNDPEFYELDTSSAGAVTVTLTTDRSCKQ